MLMTAQGPRIGRGDATSPARRCDARAAAAVLPADPRTASAAYAGAVPGPAFQSLWAEPRAADPPPRVWRDWALVAVLVPTAVVEVVVRPDVVWWPLALTMAVLITGLLLVRRTHPLAAVVIGFGSFVLADVAALVGDIDIAFGLYTSACALILVYSLFRWGSGREAVIGLPVILTAGVLGTAVDYTGVADSIAGGMVLLFPAVLGAAVRYRTNYRHRSLEQVRLRERERLARELHDTVAHHVSAIAVRAQAGQVVATTRPAAALEALRVIEAEASRTLAEMRAMVGVLRDGEHADLAPQPGVADIQRLARAEEQPRVEVTLSGDLDHLGPAVDAAVYRIAQESITNAVRHGRNATVVRVCVRGTQDDVVVTVRDDGETGSAGHGTDGYGLVGMTERAVLLGGTLEAGPATERGWSVTAVLPRVGPSR